VWCRVINLNNISDGFRQARREREIDRLKATCRAIERTQRAAGQPEERLKLFHGDNEQRSVTAKDAE